MMWIAKIEAHAMTKEAALEILTKAYEDAIKTNYEDANKGPAIWGHMSRQSGIVVEEMDMMEMRVPGFPEGRLRLERRFDQLKAEIATVAERLGIQLVFEASNNPHTPHM